MCSMSKSNISIRSAKVFLRIAGLHPELSAGFHYMSRVRSNNFFSWEEATKLERQSNGSIKAGSVDFDAKMTIAGCPCCGQVGEVLHDVTTGKPWYQQIDSFAHFLLDCTDLAEKAIRTSLEFRKYVKISKAVHAKISSSMGSAARSKLLSASVANLLLGGNQVDYKEFRNGREVVNTVVTANTSVPSHNQANIYSLLELKAWLPDVIDDDQVWLKGKVEALLVNTTRRPKFIQKEHALLEATFVLVAKFISRAHGPRQRLLWPLSSTLSPQSQSRQVGPS